MNNFLSNHHRLQSDDFKAVLKKRSLRGDCLRLKICPNEQGHCRLGMIVAKRQIPKSVQRQRVKRVIREYFRCHKSALAGLDMVFMVSAKAGKVSNQEIRQCLSQLWQQLQPHSAVSCS